MVGFSYAIGMLLIALAGKQSFAQLDNAASLASSPVTDVVLVLDNSGSMRRNDPHFLIKRTVTEFNDSLAANSRLGIVIFDTKAKMILPLTERSQSGFESLLDRALQKIDYRGQRTDIPGGLELAMSEMQKERDPDSHSVLIFLTDGIVDVGSAAKDVERTRFLRERLLPKIKQKGIRVYGVALTKSADLQLIQNLSSGTSGDYYSVLRGDELSTAFQKINTQLGALSDVGKPGPDVQDGERNSQQQEQISEPIPSKNETEAQVLAEEEPSDPIKPSQESVSQAGDISATTRETKLSPNSHGPVESEIDLQNSLDSKPNLPMSISQDWLIIAVAVIVALGLVVTALAGFRRKAKSPLNIDYQSEAVLIDISGESDEEKAYPVGTAPLRIGRSKRANDIVIDKSTVSARHATITHRNGKYYLRDLGSTNGTYVNQSKIGNSGQTSEVCLKSQDLVSIARHAFQFQCKETADDPNFLDRADFDDQTMVTPTMVLGPEWATDQTLTGYQPSMCANHPTVIGNEVCTACKKLFCARCMEDIDGKWLCAGCRSGLT